ncbi:MAG: outer membrane protein transport protein [Deltaproteobacteria bacterium]|nr:outer membrane protein transport protein [Deltaproteobacteria bacterium]
MLKIYFMIILCMVPSRASADSFLPRFMGGIDPGIPTDNKVSGIYFNPAAIGKIKGTSISLSFSPNFQTSTASRYPISTLTGNTSATPDKFFSSGSYSNNIWDFFGGITTDFGMDRITLGIAVFSPLQQDISDVPEPLKYHLVERKLMNLFISSVVSLKLHKKFHIGFGLSYVYSKIHMDVIRDRYLRGTTPDGVLEAYETGGYADEKVIVDSDDNNFGFSVGFYWLVKKWLTVGGSYRSKIRGIDSTGVRTTGSGSITRYVDGEGFTTLNGDAQLTTSFPDSYNLGAKIKLSRYWEGDFTLTWTRWSTHKSMKILLSGNDFTNSSLTNWDLNISSYRGFQDTITPQLTMFYTGLRGFSFITSLRYLPPSTPLSWVNPSVVDNHSVELLLSSTFKVFSNMSIRLGYAVSYMFETDVSKSGYDPSLAIICLDNHIDVVWSQACRDTYAGKAMPTAAGVYNRITHQIGLGIELSF